jgi:hypothetical protein
MICPLYFFSWTVKQSIIDNTANTDGASVTSGHSSGVQAKIKDDAEWAIYVRCYAHRVNLVVVDVGKVGRIRAESEGWKAEARIRNRNNYAKKTSVTLFLIRASAFHLSDSARIRPSLPTSRRRGCIDDVSLN